MKHDIFRRLMFQVAGGPGRRKAGRAMAWSVFCGIAVLWAGCASQQQQDGMDARANTGGTQQRARATDVRSRSGTSQQQQQQQQQQRRPEAPITAIPAAQEPAAQMPSGNEGRIETDLVTLQKSAPASAAIGETFEYVLTYTAHEDLDSLIITDQPGDGLTFVRSEPAASMTDSNLVWTLKDIAKGQSGTIRVSVKAEREGMLANCATVQAIPQVCVGTFVGRALISIEKTGPARAVIGSDVTYNITVMNSGSLPARDVVITDTVPEGMSHSSGQRTLSVNVGELAPNQSKQYDVTLKADARGRHCNVAQVTTANAGEARSEACTEVLVPGLRIAKTGDKEQFLSRSAKYQIVIANTGDTTLTDVVVTDTAPAPTSIASASGANVSGNTATWNVGNLAPGEEKSFDITLTSRTPGNHCNTATVAAAGGLRESAEACTEWRGVSALLLEKADDPDPIQVGENTTYTVRVTNQGTADDTNVKVVVEFPAEIDPVSASNGGVVSGKTVTFPAFPRLTPKQAFEYSIIAKGASVGDARVRFIRTSDGIPAPTTAEESTRVY